jgi:hypothetical protein
MSVAVSSLLNIYQSVGSINFFKYLFIILVCIFSTVKANLRSNHLILNILKMIIRLNRT